MIVGDQVMIAVFEGGHDVEGDHLAGQVIDVLDAEVNPDGAPVGADPRRWLRGAKDDSR